MTPRRIEREFRRIRREERASGAKVVVAKAFCREGFPCLANMLVYAGVDEPCQVCAVHLEEMRRLHGWMKIGDYWQSASLADEQQKLIASRIREAEEPR